MSKGSLEPKIRFLGQKVCSVARVQTDRQTDRHTHRQTDTTMNTEDTLSEFHEVFLRPIIKDRSNMGAKNGNPSQKMILLSDHMINYIVRFLVWDVDRNTLCTLYHLCQWLT